MRKLELLLLLVVVFSGVSLCAADDLVIVQPGYPGSTAEAAAFVARLCAAVRAEGGPGIGAGEYHNNEQQGIDAIRAKRPTVGIVSLGFALKHQKSLALRPLLWSHPDEAFHILVRKDTLRKLGDLEGRTVTGTPLLEPEFVQRVLFADARTNWQSDGAKFFSRAVRNVVRGRRDAVLLSNREYRGFLKLRYAQDLEVLHTTEAYPTAVVVAFGARLSGKEETKLSAALKNLPNSIDGKTLLEEMGIAGFRAVDEERWGKLVVKYSQTPPKAK